MTSRTTAPIVGVLFIVATATAMVGGVLLLPPEESGPLARVEHPAGAPRPEKEPVLASRAGDHLW